MNFVKSSLVLLICVYFGTSCAGEQSNNQVSLKDKQMAQEENIGIRQVVLPLDAIYSDVASLNEHYRNKRAPRRRAKGRDYNDIARVITGNPYIWRNSRTPYPNTPFWVFG